METEPTKASKYPECEKWSKLTDKFDIIQEFLDECSNNNIYVRIEKDDKYMAFLDAFRFVNNVDSAKLEKEREQLIEELCKEADELISSIKK